MGLSEKYLVFTFFIITLPGRKRFFSGGLGLLMILGNKKLNILNSVPIN